MASRKGGKVDVSFFDTDKGFKVAGKGVEMTFDLLSEFREMAHKEGWPAQPVASVERAVVDHYVGLEVDVPVGEPNLFEGLSAAKGSEVVFAPESGGYRAKLPYHPAIVSMMRGVPGAAFDGESKQWRIPVESRGALVGALAGAGQVLSAVEAAREQIGAQARQAITAGQTGADPDASVRITSFHRANWIYSGPVIAANPHFVAQLVDGQKESAQVVIHQSAALDRQVYAGDEVGVSYDANGTATVLTGQQARERLGELAREKFNATIGQKVDGVLVARSDGGMLVSLDYNPKAAAQLYALKKYDADGVAFNRDLGGYLVSDDVLGQPGAMEDLSRAVQNVRREVREEAEARKEIDTIAQEKLTGARVQFAQGKDGEFQSGQILAVTDRYVLQSAGREYMKAHDVGRLAQVPVVGQTVTIRYGAQGKAAVQERSQSQSQSRSR
ncbi:KfrB domain-containing protein [Trinickia mobilis]|uniref:KfrB domain-containing protein n=1 Tax=Trinickia mobilis TaxID=2816356 RepID=UPI001A907BB5|nr:hypothetical protein [Trinickia mobilis]